MANIVSFKIQIEGSNELKTVTFSADELGKALDAVRSNAKTLNGELVNIGAVSQVLESVSSAIQQLNGLMVGLTSAYADQIEAETKLATAMRNTMDASDEEIQRIKELASAQQQLGIVGDEVQLAAAQELATYLSLSSSLETIIPTMNDMIAQQLGLGASAESATQIATMLGKVMNGQTKALSRYGYEFSEAQEYILKFGDESERAAVLCQVVGESVGGMNEALAKTDVGRQQQLANTLGDIREIMGGLVQRAQPYITSLSQISLAVTGVLQLKNAIKAVLDTQVVATAGAKLYAAAQHLLARAGYTAAAGTTAMNAAVAALYATLTMGLSIAVTALINLFTRLGKKGKEVAGIIDGATDANKAYADASMNVRLELAEETIKLESLIKSKQDATKAVADLNSKYGEIFGSHKTAAEWYDVLTQKSAAYAKQIGYEAQAKVIASQKAAKELEKIDKENRMRELADKAAEPMKNYGTTYYRSSVYKADAAEWRALKADVDALNKEINGLQGTFDSCTKNMAEAALEIGTITTVTGGASKNTRTLSDDVADYRKNVERAVQVNQTFGGTVKDIDIRLKAMESGITSLIGKYGNESATIQNLIQEYADLRRAREASIPALQKISAESMPQSYKTRERDALGNRKTVYATPTVETPKIGAGPGYKPTQNDLAVRKYREIKAQIPTADPSQLKILQSQLATLRELYEIPEENVSSVQSSVDAFGALADAMGSLSGIVDESAASWLTWGANLLKAISAALPQLAALFAGETAVAGAGAMSSVASIPYVGPILAIAALASIVAAAATLPKFAEGGLAYGPTLGIFGEYPGAANNPEVVAPLNKLRDIIEPSSGFGQVEFKIDGYVLKGILRKVNRLDYRNNG